MKKTQKKALGLLGLSVVTATTVYAACLPAPEAEAISSQIVDTIVVRVLATTPDVSINETGGADAVTSPEKTFDYDYANIDHLTIVVKYTDKDGVEHEKTLDTLDIDDEYGSGSLNIDLTGDDYGYGDYIIQVTGESNSGVTDQDTISFSYYPLTATAEEDETIDGAKVKIEYDAENPDIDKIEINVYDANGNLVEGLSPIVVTPPETEAGLDFGKYGLDSGTYTISVTALDANGEPLYKPYLVSFVYEREPAAVPNTGGMFSNLNISRTDYLITGLIIFGLTAMAGLGFAAKNRGNTKQSRKRR